MRNKFSVLHTPVGLSSPVTDLTDAVYITEKEGIKTAVDDFSFRIMAKSKYDDFFNDGDRIRIYASSGNNTPAILQDGFIKDIGLELSLNSKMWSISGQNRLEMLLNAPLSIIYSNTGSFNNSALAIKNIISRAAGQFKVAKYLPSITGELSSLGGKIDDQTYSLKTFDPPGYSRSGMPAFQMIEELSGWKWTGQDAAVIGTYIYFLDTNNEFNWQPKNNTVQTIIEQGDFLSGSVKKTLFDVINMAIIDAGVDFNGRPIKTWVFRPTAQTKGLKGKYFVNHEIATNMKDPLSITSDVPFGNKDRSGNTNNGTFRNNVREEAKKWGNGILSVFGEPRFKATLLFRGTTAYAKGNLHTLRIKGVFRNQSDLPANQLDLRIYNITHTFNKKGWFTNIEFVQDEVSITGGAI